MPEMPTWEGFMTPCLAVLSDGSTRSRREMNALAADAVGLSDDQRATVLSSGQPMYANRIGWALSFLARVGALSRPSRGNYRLTGAGRQVLARFPDSVTENDIKALGDDPNSGIQPYVASTRLEPVAKLTDPTPTPLDPTEQIEQGVARVHEAVAKELLERLRGKEPAFFEQAVVDLLVAMGYGGTGGVAAATQLVNDGGIDGIIDQDVLGLNKVYVQAKRYAAGNSVQRPELQGFVGALIGKADRGVFITTSTFSKGAIEYADRSTAARLILIDGARLTELMIRFGVGVQVKDTFHVVEIDEDFFE
ncbi:MAG: restriction endonuclease [Actinobacteria bacterium HGW-Actinobacteria-5]|jgi:restriction system protein|nr:MAG: restriction endonuclease [Actinobacteria bacterium HGW-Actinobacteria-5]